MSRVCLCFLYLIICLFSVIDCLSLRRLRDGIEREWPRAPVFDSNNIRSAINANYHRFMDSLPEQEWFLPLCGNGKVDKIQDYELLASNSKNYGVLFMGNEVCDDGNRLDGDGCSADCSDLDLFSDPCELWLTHNGTTLESIDEVAMDKDTGNLYVYSEPTKTIYSLPHASIKLDWSVALSDSVIVMHYHHNVVYAVTKAFTIVEISTQTKSIHTVTPLDLEPKLDPAFLQAKLGEITTGNDAKAPKWIHCLVRYNDTVLMYSDDSRTGEKMQLDFPAKNLASLSADWWQDDFRYPVDLKKATTREDVTDKLLWFSLGPFRKIKHSRIERLVEPLVLLPDDSERIKQKYQSIFDFLLGLFLRSGILNEQRLPQYKVWVQNNSHAAGLQSFIDAFAFSKENDVVFRSRVLYANPLLFHETRSFIRSYLRWNASMSPSLQIPHTNGYTLGRRMFNVGLQRELDHMKNIKSDNYTLLALLYILTTDTEYTFLKPKQYTHVFKKSWLEEIDDVLGDSSIDIHEDNSLDFTKENSRILSLLQNKTKDLIYSMFYHPSRKHKSISFLGVNPQSDSIWILQNKKLHLVTKKGVLVKNPASGACLPIEFFPCLSCHWSPSDFKSCVPCQNKPQDPNSADQSKWSIQCRSCSDNSRRLLQQPSKNAISFSVQSTALTLPQIESHFRDSSFHFANRIMRFEAEGMVVDITIENPQNPPETLREIQHILTQNSDVMTVVSTPTLNYYEPSLFALSGQSNENSQKTEDHTVLYVGIGTGVGGAILIVIIIFFIYARHKNARKAQFNHSFKKLQPN